MERTAEDLKRLKREWYADAVNSRMIERIYTVCRELGTRLNARYGPKYEYADGGLVVFVDDYGNYMTVRLDGKQVCSTHPCDHLFVPGEWTKKIETAYPDAVAQVEQKRMDRENAAREKLACELGLV